MAHNERFFLLPLYGQQDHVSYFANSILVVHMDAPRWPVVGGVAKGAIVHHANTGHLLNGTAGDGDAECALAAGTAYCLTQERTHTSLE